MDLTGPAVMPATEIGVQWNVELVVRTVVLYIIAAAFEVAGGWLVWQTVRVGKPGWWAFLGCLALILYGYIPTLQPIAEFGRVFAVYGGFFIVFSYGWGWVLDGNPPDKGDYVGAAIALLGVLVCLFWPRQRQQDVRGSSELQVSQV